MNRFLRVSKRFAGVALLTVVALALGMGFIGNAEAKSKPKVTVAANFPMTGELGFYGEILKNGMLIGEDIAKEKYPNGPDVKFLWGDNTGSPQTTISVMQQQLLQKPNIYTSALKPQTMAITEQISKKGIPHFTWILDITINPHSNNNLRTWFSFKHEAEKFIEYAKKRSPKRVAMMYLRTPAGEEEYNDVLAPAMREMGAEVLLEGFDFGVTDFKPLAAKIKAFQPDLLIINGFVPQMIGQIRALRPLGLIEGGNTLASLDMLDAAGELGADEIEGIVVAAPLFLTKPDEDPAKSFRERFRAKFGKEPSHHSAYAADMIQVIYDAAQRLTLPATSAQWIKAIRETKMNGVTGPISFDEDGSSASTLQLGVYRNGKLQGLQ